MRDQLGVSPAHQRLTIDGVSIAFERSGHGQPVVCLHAVAHGARDFEKFAEVVSDRFEVIRVDWPGHGRSDPDHVFTSATRYADILDQLLAQLDLHRVILVGCSIGGAAALQYASHNPSRLAALVLCNPGGLVELTPSVRRAIGFMARFFGAGAKGARWFGFAYRLYYRLLVLPQRAAAAQRERIIEAGYDMSPLLRDAWQSFSMPDADLRADAARITLPVWFAWAKKDKLIQLKACRPAIDAMPHATLTVFRAGHAAFLEQPKRFAKGFRKFAATL